MRRQPLATYSYSISSWHPIVEHAHAPLDPLVARDKSGNEFLAFVKNALEKLSPTEESLCFYAGENANIASAVMVGCNDADIIRIPVIVCEIEAIILARILRR